MKDIIGSLTWHLTREAVKSGVNHLKEQHSKNVINSKSTFRKLYNKFLIPGKPQQCIERWRQLCLCFEQEYASPSHLMRVRQHEYLEGDVGDLEFQLSQIRRAYPEIYEECMEFYLDCKEVVIKSLESQI